MIRPSLSLVPRRRWARAALVALGVTLASALGATAAHAEPTDPAPASETITVDGEWRTLKGWTSESVPAYTCPADHPYLLSKNFTPDIGTALPLGVQIFEQPWNPGMWWPIGVSITGNTWVPDPADPQRELHTGTKTGPMDSSATNWLTTDAQYMVRLHCTNDTAAAASNR